MPNVRVSVLSLDLRTARGRYRRCYTRSATHRTTVAVVGNWSPAARDAWPKQEEEAEPRSPDWLATNVEASPVLLEAVRQRWKATTAAAAAVVVVVLPLVCVYVCVCARAHVCIHLVHHGDEDSNDRTLSVPNPKQLGMSEHGGGARNSSRATTGEQVAAWVAYGVGPLRGFVVCQAPSDAAGNEGRRKLRSRKRSWAREQGGAGLACPLLLLRRNTLCTSAPRYRDISGGRSRYVWMFLWPCQIVLGGVYVSLGSTKTHGFSWRGCRHSASLLSAWQTGIGSLRYIQPTWRVCVLGVGMHG